MIYAFSDTFIVDFTKETLFFIVITEKGFELSTFQNPIVDFRRSSNGSPYTGAYINHHLLNTPILIIFMGGL